ncbi:Conserved_hypothetical protein [Hexamita inflata]|uniref:Transmembrane protein n=1 Tax=Hexamita inflata TaxID=28002 RepID=A0AA86R390_9EUKA|nr:Conserved hypothetical protein [Hexamita inflata]
MIHIQNVLSLLCFQSNTTVLLDVQTRELVFKAWPRTDQTRETNICNSLNGDIYLFSVQVGTQIYVFDHLQIFDSSKYIQITIPCSETDKCKQAFKANSAVYTMEFQEANQIVKEVAQNLRRLDFNRKACADHVQLLYAKDYEISPGVLSHVYKMDGIPKYCKYPIDLDATINAHNYSNAKAKLLFQAYPSFGLIQTMFSVTPDYLNENNGIACIRLPTPELKTWCNNMVQTFATQSFGFAKMQYFVPGIIPERDGSLSRIINYTTIYQTNKVVNAYEDTFDCYSHQSLLIYDQTLLLTNTMNPNMIYCNQQIQDYVGIEYDQIITRITFQQNEDFKNGDVYTIDFKTKSQIFNTSFEWLSCNIAINQTQCKEIILNKQIMIKYILNAQQLIYKNNNIVKIFPLNPTMSLSCYSDAQVEIYNTQSCVKILNNCQTDIQNQNIEQIIYSFGNNGAYSNNLLNISSFVLFPNLNNTYCINFNFSDQLTTDIVNQFTRQPSGALQIGNIYVPISFVIDNSKFQKVENIQWIVVAVAIVTILVISIGLYIELK